MSSVGQQYLDDMIRLSTQVPAHKGAEAVHSLRRTLEAAFPGPVQLHSIVLVMIAANILADMLSEIEPAMPIVVPEADVRVAAVKSAFVQILHDAVRERSVSKHLGRRIQTLKNGGG